MTDRQRAIDIKLTNEIHFMDMYVCLYLCSCIYRHNVCNVYYFMDEIRKITTNKLQRQQNQRKKKKSIANPCYFICINVCILKIVGTLTQKYTTGRYRGLNQIIEYPTESELWTK